MKNKVGFWALGVLLILSFIPVVVKDDYILNILIMAFIWSVVVLAWDLITGYAGVFSFGQIAFFVIGAYASGMLTKSLSISPWMGIVAAGLITSVAGIAIGLPCLRIKGVYIALVTYGLHLVLPTLISHGERFGTGGTAGLLDIPPLKIGAYVFPYLDKTPWYYAALVVSAVSVFCIYKIIKSPIGLAFASLRDAEPFAKSLGVNEYKYKLLVFAVSAFFTGAIGGFYSHYSGSISHRLLGLDLFLLVMIMVTIGGMGQFPASLASTFVVMFLNEFLRSAEEYRLIILGGLVVLVILIAPKGMVVFVSDLTRKVGQKMVKGGLKTL